MDIVVPVYGNVEGLRRCISAVAAHTPPHRLIVIDDASPDPAVGEYLSTLSNCHVFRNSVNRGFVGTVNRALRMSSNDVVVLNSDAIVTPRWLEKMLGCAYSGPSVATVTPLTNYGTIAAVPLWNQKNELPPGHTIDSFAQLVEDSSARSYPELPTAVGFCMLIRREAIDAVGYFDETTFGRGYGEENDFCLRATLLGYRHLLDDATFVYHEGGQSFGPEAQRLLDSNYRILLEKHPDYDGLIQRFLQRNPLADIQNSIERSSAGEVRRRLRVLILLHGPLNTMAGTEAHARDLIASVDAADMLVAYRNGSVLVVKEHRSGVEVRSMDFTPPVTSETGAGDWYRRLLRELRVQVIHVEHLMNQATAIVSAASSLGIPIVFVWEDYYLLCPKYNLLTDAGTFCNWCRDLNECDRCLGSQGAYPAGFQKVWRTRNQRLIDKIDAHVFLCEASLRGVTQVFSIRPASVRMIPHALSNSRRITASHTPRESRSLRVAFLGVQLPQKGFAVFSEVIRLCGIGEIEWYTFGASPPAAPTVARSDVVHHGAYDRERIPELLNEAGIDVVLLLSTWPETFCYTLTEAWQAGIPVIGSSLGAIGERIVKSGAGWTVDTREPQEIVALLRHLHSDRTEISEKALLARTVELPELADMAATYGELYRELLSRGEASRAQI